MNAIHLPVFQRYDCQGCTHCCRHLVNVNEKDRKRIMAAGWEQKLPGPLFVAYKFSDQHLYHLARQPDGACIFLTDNNLCRLHAETGPASKPLACRAYPLVVTPGADGVRVDLRLDCPSAAANQGRPLTAHISDIQRIAAETGITHGMAKIPSWPGGRELTPDEFLAVTEGFERILIKTGVPLRVRLAAGSRLLDLLYEAKVENVRKLRFLELMNLLTNAAVEDASQGTPPPPLPARSAQLFRQWLFLHTLTDDPDAWAKGRIARWRSSWQRYGCSRRFAEGAGVIPRMRPDWPDATFERIQAIPTAPEEAWEPLCRSLRLKLDAHAFAGPGYFGYDLLAGLTSLWLMPAVVSWLARLAAVRRGGTSITAQDVLEGLRQAHFTYGVSPVFAKISERLRIRGLARPGVPGAILAEFGP